MNYFIEDLNVFYATIYGGILIGFLFDINRSIKNNFICLKKVHFICDIIFCIVATLVTFITINAVEKFELRYYHFVALILGFILYYNTISKFILEFNTAIIKFSKLFLRKTVSLIISIVESLYYILIYTVHFLFDVILYIPSAIFSTKPKAPRKSSNKKIKKSI